MSAVSPGLVRLFQALTARPVAVFMGVLALLGMSFIAMTRIPIELFPEGFASDSISVLVPWNGANPQEVEEKIVRPLEEELGTLTGLQEINAVAAPGRATVILSFPGHMDMDLVYAEVSDRVERVRPRLPREADRITISRFTSADIPVIWSAVLYPTERQDESQEIFEEVLKPRIEGVEGVASVEMHGIIPRSVRIWLDEEQTAANRVNVGELLTRLQADNISAPVGDLDSSGNRYIVRVDGRFTSLEEIADFPVDGDLRIRDIGRVEMVRSAPDSLFRMNGRYGLAFAVYKETNANTFEVCRKVQHLLEEELPRDPVLGQFEYTVFFNTGETIEQTLRDLVEDAGVGGLIAVVVLFLFLRRLRFTLLIAVSIPFSVLLTLAWLYFQGDSFNLLSMAGITISIGMLVDNSVVIVESIFRRREEGESLEEATSRGPAEMVLPVVTATLTSVVVFVPVMFMSEDRNTRLFATGIGIPLCIALLAALLLAVVIVPVSARQLARRGGRRKALPASPWSRRAGAWMGGLVEWSQRHRLGACLVALLFLGTYGLSSAGTRLVPTGDGEEGGMTVRFEFSANTTLEQAEAEILRLEEHLDADIAEALGNPALGIDFSRRGGSLFLWYDRQPRSRERERILQELERRLPRSAAIEWHFESEFNRQNKEDDDWIQVLIQGPDSDRVEEIAEEVRERARRHPAFREVDEPVDPAREVLLTLDRDRLQRAGTTSLNVLGTVEWGLRGILVSRFQTDYGDLPVIMEFDREQNPGLQDLRSLAVAWFGNGAALDLSNFARFEHRRSPRAIFRRDSRTMAVVGLQPAEKDLQKNHAALAELMAGVELPEGYSWSQGGGWEDFQQDMRELGLAMLLSVVLVFFLMGLLFESLILPFSCLVTIPFALVGSSWAFWVSGADMDLVGMIGGIVLVGVVVNNGIVLVDRILTLQRRGLERRRALRQAVEDRFRPVLMTAVTTICGLLPIALSAESSGNMFSFQGLAIGVIGGLFFSTFFTLWTVPLAFSLFQDLGAAGRRRLWGRLAGAADACQEQPGRGQSPAPRRPRA